MKLIVPVFIIGFIGGLLDTITDLSKFWCFIIGIVAFVCFLFIKSIFKTAQIMKQTKDKKKIWIDQDNNVVKSE